MPEVHHLKTLSEFFSDVKSGNKTFEVRQNDRNFQVGDTLILDEFNTDKQIVTGAWVPKEITYILDDPRYCKEGFVILGIKDIKI